MDDVVLDLECEAVHEQCRASGYGPRTARLIVIAHRGDPAFWRRWGTPGAGTVPLWAYVNHLAERVANIMEEDLALWNRGIDQLAEDA